MMNRVFVIDTNVFIGALMRQDGINRVILERCFRGQIKPLMGDALYYEYEDLLHRNGLFPNSSFDLEERLALFDDFCSICAWVPVHYRWRPNLRDEADNHVIELALAGNAERILTWNVRDFQRGDMILPDVEITTPMDFLQSLEKGGH
jgi:putative PIN family toxin of toxin-antitoxin system